MFVSKGLLFHKFVCPFLSLLNRQLVDNSWASRDSIFLQRFVTCRLSRRLFVQIFEKSVDSNFDSFLNLSWHFVSFALKWDSFAFPWDLFSLLLLDNATPVRSDSLASHWCCSSALDTRIRPTVYQYSTTCLPFSNSTQPANQPASLYKTDQLFFTRPWFSTFSPLPPSLPLYFIWKRTTLPAIGKSLSSSSLFFGWYHFLFHMIPQNWGKNLQACLQIFHFLTDQRPLTLIPRISLSPFLSMLA